MNRRPAASATDRNLRTKKVEDTYTLASDSAGLTLPHRITLEPFNGPVNPSRRLLYQHVGSLIFASIMIHDET